MTTDEITLFLNYFIDAIKNFITLFVSSIGLMVVILALIVAVAFVGFVLRMAFKALSGGNFFRSL